MTPSLRAHRAPPAVRTAWALGSAAGAAALLIAAFPPRSAPAPNAPVTSAAPPTPTAQAPRPNPVTSITNSGGLQPSTVSAALSRVLPRGATEPRVSGLYGSGHYGNWQFTAFLLWRAPDGTSSGGRVDLPAAGDTPPEPLGLDASRLDREYDAGWPLVRLDQSIADLDGPAARLSLIELEIPLGERAVITHCGTTGQDQVGTCWQKTDGRDPIRFNSEFTDDPTAASLSVRLANR